VETEVAEVTGKGEVDNISAVEKEGASFSPLFL
jgi:hypothetical protein